MEEDPQTRSEEQSRVICQAFLIAPHASRTLLLASRDGPEDPLRETAHEAIA
jgi:hypothetical protein